MNIFATDPDPKVAAYHLDDKRVIKMILESAQMLSTAIRSRGLTHDWLYKRTHESHPCSIWVRESRENFDWLITYSLELCAAYTYVYGRVHKSEAFIRRYVEYRYLFKSKGLQPFTNCSNYPELETNLAYRVRLLEKWETIDKRAPTWKNRELPYWLSQEK